MLALERRHGQGTCSDRLPNQPSHEDAHLTKEHLKVRCDADEALGHLPSATSRETVVAMR